MRSTSGERKSPSLRKKAIDRATYWFEAAISDSPSNNAKCYMRFSWYWLIEWAEYTQQAEELAQTVLSWWEEHQYDVMSEDGEEWNVFHTKPEFIKLAEQFLNTR
jgi:hypothetical protein